MDINEIAGQVDPAKAQLAIARAMVAFGSEPIWDSETIEHVSYALSPAFPTGLPPVFDEEDEAAAEFWQNVE
jgi:hypothetical protein